MNGRRGMAAALLLAAAGWATVAGAAGGFQLRAAHLELEDGVYRLDAGFRLVLGDTVREALRNGVPVTVMIEVEVSRPRRWVWDKELVSRRRGRRIEYHPLTERYVVTRLDGGGHNLARASFADLGAALDYAGEVHAMPVVRRARLEDGKIYRVRLRARLAIEALPAPMRLWTRVSREWQLSTPWHEMEIP